MKQEELHQQCNDKLLFEIYKCKINPIYHIQENTIQTSSVMLYTVLHFMITTVEVKFIACHTIGDDDNKSYQVR